jgi:hypothetical protein
MASRRNNPRSDEVDDFARMLIIAATMPNERNAYADEE